jgi:uncharacterized Ntn-hydrolase superfamily protein
MKWCWSILLIALSSGILQAQVYDQNEPLAHTYSIVARDSASGDLAVAVQSHWFSVGSMVSWGEAGVGVIATQSFVNPSFGPRGLQLLKQGYSAQQVLDILVKYDEGRDFRQLAIVDAKGKVAAYTGAKCIIYAGDLQGNQYSVQANMMLNDKVVPAMKQAMDSNQSLPIAERIMAAMKAAQAAGGDIRGQQSAVLLVFKVKSTGELWKDNYINLRVDDHTQPIEELDRLLKVFRAYEHMNNGDLKMETSDMNGAMKEYNEAMAMYPDNLEMKFWTAVTMLNQGETEKSMVVLKEIFKADNNWKELFKRLPASGLVIATPSVIQRILQ